MRWLPLLALAGCVPISADEYSGGAKSIDSSVVPSTMSDDAGMDAASVDAFVDAAPALDAGNVSVDAGRLRDGASEPVVIDCKTRNVLCDDFESGPACPNVPGPTWSECERINDATGPQREELAGGSFALRSRVSADAGGRSQRLLRMLPVDADYFEAQFVMITDPTDNPSFTWMKVQQEVGMDANGAPINYPGVSLLGENGKMVVHVETQQTNSANGSQTQSKVLGPWPSGWIHVTVQVNFVRPSVHVEYYDPRTPLNITGYTANNVTVNRQYFALGLYAEQPGAVQMLFDDVQIFARKDGKIMALP